jgi:uncharacterized paraquat-inducible protein A
MISIEIGTAVVLYLLSVLAVIGAAGIYNGIRRWTMREKATPTRIFRCAHCAHPYLDAHNLERARCPRCGAENEPQRI